MNRQILVLLFVLCSLACARAQEDKRCIVSQVSYAVPVDRADMIRHQHLRETVIYFLKKSGFNVVPDSLLPRRKVDFEYVPLERLRDLDRDALLINLLYDGHLHVQLSQGAATDLKQIDVPDDTNKFLPYIAESLGVYLKSGADTAIQPLAKITPDALPSKTLADSRRLNWTWWQRLIEINKLLELVDVNKATGNTYLELAADCALHACYFCRTDEPNCQKYFGKALLFAEIAADTSSSRAGQISTEIALLARRFGAGYRTALSGPPLLPEVAALNKFETLQLETTTEYPPVTNLFDFLVRSESVMEIKGRDDVLKEYAFQSPAVLDRGLIFAKPQRDNFDAHLLFGHNPDITLDDVVAIIRQPAFLPSLGERAGEVYRLWQEEPKKLMEGLDLHSFESELTDTRQLPSVALLLLALNNEIESEAKNSAAFGNSFRLSLSDVYTEIVNRNTESVINLQAILKAWGWESQKAADYLLTAYGQGRNQSFKLFPAPAEFRVEHILDWNELGEKLLLDSASVTTTPAKLLWSSLGPSVQEKIKAQRIFDESTQEAVIDALNLSLSKRYLYKDHAFDSIKLDQQTKSLVDQGTERATKEALANLNRQLWERGLGYLVETKDYSAPLPNCFQLELLAAADKAANLYFTGKFDKSFQVLQPLLSRFELESTAIEYDPRYKDSSILELLYQTMCRSGRIDEALSKISAINHASFAEDDFRYKILRWRLDDFSGVPESFGVNTNSYKDYQTRAEHAFRVHDFAQMSEVLAKFHYGDNVEIDCQRTLCAILNGKQDDEADWRNFSGYLGSCLGMVGSDFFPEEFLHHWVKLLDKEFPNNPYWMKVKDDQRLENWKALCEAEALLDGAGSADDLLQAYQTTKAITSAYADEHDLATDWLFQKALRYEHQALGRYILARTQGLVDLRTMGDFAPLITETVGKTKKYAQAPGMTRGLIPLEAWFIYYMKVFGADSANIAEFCSKLPDAANLFSSGDPMFVKLLSHPAVFRVLLDESASTRQTFDLNALPIKTDFKMDFESLFQAAIAGQDIESATACAAKIVLASGDFHPLAMLFKSGESAKSWIDRNAPTKKTEADWLTILGQSSHTSPGVGLHVVDPAKAPDLIEDVTTR